MIKTIRKDIYLCTNCKEEFVYKKEADAHSKKCKPKALIITKSDLEKIGMNKSELARKVFEDLEIKDSTKGEKLANYISGFVPCPIWHKKKIAEVLNKPLEALINEYF